MSDLTSAFEATLGVIIVFLAISIPAVIAFKIEPSLPHKSWNKTYYTEEYFCMGCGNFLGNVKPTGSCSNCGSNRWSTEDPGAGTAMRHR